MDNTNTNEMTEVTLTELETVDGGFAWMAFFAGVAVCAAFDIEVKVSIGGYSGSVGC